MSGHSKWSNNKYRKAAQDAKRGKIFSKIIRELVVSARLGGCDPTSNPRLRSAIDKALYNNMTRDTLNRAIARGIGDNASNNMKTFIYEGYGPGGIAIMIECLSDNRNRTVSEIRYAFSKCGGSLSTDGSVSYLFKKRGVIYFEKGDEEALIEEALKAGAEDIVVCDNGKINVYTPWKTLETVRDTLEAIGLETNGSEILMIPHTTLHTDSETISRLRHLIDILEECDDVQKVYHNGLICDKISLSG